MNRQIPVPALAVILMISLASTGWWLHQKNQAAKAATSPMRAVQVDSHGSSAEATNLMAALNAFLDAKSVSDRKLLLHRLLEALKNGDKAGTVRTIRRVLDAGTDAKTGLGFKVSANGFLLEAPTLRTLLLDYLGALDPAAAADYAREILAAPSSPDEWAIALRNLANGDASTNARTLLETKTAELFHNEAWQRDPSVGYLEAFDTAVYLGDTQLLSPLTDLVREQDNQTVAQAAFLAVDRLVIDHPAEVLAVMAQNPGWMTGRETTRADYFARADVSDPAQRRLLESYLLDESRSPAELQTFIGIFPNVNFMISQNLLTSNTTLGGQQLAQRYQVSRAAVDQWLADPRFGALQPQLEILKTRLDGMVKPTQP